jgi:outer membrane protein TolC
VRLENAVAAEYVSARYNTLRLITAQAIAGLTSRRFDLLKQNGGAEDETMRQARQQAGEAADRVARFEALRSASVARLAHMLDGQSPRMLAAVLQPALEDSRLVVPTLDIPLHVPGVLLRRRADVAAAEASLSLTGRVSPHERLQFAQYVQALSSNIGPTAPDSTHARAASDGGDIEQVLESARADVAHKLWQLKDCAEAAAKAREDLDAADAQVRDAMAGRDAGRLSELDELGTQARFLGAADRMAVAAGAVSLAWVAFQASIGGAGSGQLSAAADLR